MTLLIILIFTSFLLCSSCSPKAFSHSKKIFDVSVKSREFIFLSDANGKVIITKADTNDVIITYQLPKISESIVAVVGEKFYNIDTVNGMIANTDLKDVITSPKLISWNIVASFPSEQDWIRNSVAVNDSSIYFATKSGILYLFDTKKEKISKVGNVCEYSNYASLIVIDNILCIHKCKYFYSFDGNTLQELRTPDLRYDSGLFKFEKSVCRVGGNLTNLFPDPVYCYDTIKNVWTVVGQINEARLKPAVVATKTGTYIFGGKAVYNSGVPSSFWRETVEVFNHKTKLWDFSQSPFSIAPEDPQAVAFYF